MKTILVTGNSSYIGSSFLASLRDDPALRAEGLSLRGAEWRERSFAGVDTILHTAGLAHAKQTVKNTAQFFEVNRDLTLEVAKKAKEEGVRQFIFLSSMSVYGLQEGVVTPETQPDPTSCYGRSKYEAEQGLRRLEDESFRVCVLRPPMVYGKGCKGNFNIMVRLMKKTAVFPKLDNRRSLLSIDNLCAFLKIAAEEELDGLWFPQDRERISTTDMARWIAEGLGRRCLFSAAAGAAVKAALPLSEVARKAFCSLSYEDTEVMDYRYCVEDSKTAILRAVR